MKCYLRMFLCDLPRMPALAVHLILADVSGILGNRCHHRVSQAHYELIAHESFRNDTNIDLASKKF